MGEAVREETHGHVRRLTLCRAERHNTIAPQLRDEFGEAIDTAERHTQERLDFVTRSGEVGIREAVRERDRPFGDYGERSS